jgi:hypothetical protein
MSRLNSTNINDVICNVLNQLQCNVCNQARAICALEERITQLETTENEIPTAVLEDQQPMNTAGGASAIGLQTRVLNTIQSDSGVGVTLAVNQFTLPAGTYRIEASAPAFSVAGHFIQLEDVPNTFTVIGTSELAINIQTRSFLSHVITIAVATTFRIRHYTSVVNGNGLGVPVNAANPEVYTQVTIQRIGA